MGKQSSRLNADRAKKLGAAIKKARVEQGITQANLAKGAGLSRSYLAYFEGGRFSEVGLDKFARLIEVLGVPADSLLRQAGYVPGAAESLPDPKTYIKEVFDLSPTALGQALAFIDFLVVREAPKKKLTTVQKK